MEQRCADGEGSSWLPSPEEGLEGWPWVAPAPEAATSAVLVGFCFLLGFVAELLLALKAARPRTAAERQQPAPTLAAPVSLPPSQGGLFARSAAESTRLAERYGSELPVAPTCPLAAEFPAVHPGACTVSARTCTSTCTCTCACACHACARACACAREALGTRRRHLA